MKENIVCSGALFYATGTKRFLFLQRTDKKTQGMWGLVGGKSKFTYLVAIESEFIPKLNEEHSGYCWTAFECWPKNLHMGLKNTLNNKSIKGKLQTILDLIV